MTNYETPPKAFSAEKATKETRTENSNWMKAESND